MNNNFTEGWEKLLLESEEKQVLKSALESLGEFKNLDQVRRRSVCLTLCNLGRVEDLLAAPSVIEDSMLIPEGAIVQVYSAAIKSAEAQQIKGTEHYFIKLENGRFQDKVRNLLFRDKPETLGAVEMEIITRLYNLFNTIGQNMEYYSVRLAVAIHRKYRYLAPNLPQSQRWQVEEETRTPQSHRPKLVVAQPLNRPPGLMGEKLLMVVRR